MRATTCARSCGERASTMPSTAMSAASCDASLHAASSMNAMIDLLRNIIPAEVEHIPCGAQRNERVLVQRHHPLRQQLTGRGMSNANVDIEQRSQHERAIHHAGMRYAQLRRVHRQLL